MNKRVIQLGLALVMGTTSTFAQTFNVENPAGRTGPGLDLNAYEVYYSMYDQSIDLMARELTVLGTNRTVPITFGAEKEGSSSKILRVMSPPADLIVIMLKTDPELAKWFIENLINRSILEKNPVINSEGEVMRLNQEALLKLQTINWQNFAELKYDRNSETWTNEQLKTEFQAAIAPLREVFPGSPFSFLKKKTRKDIWERKSGDDRILRAYDYWVPLYGEAEKIHSFRT